MSVPVNKIYMTGESPKDLIDVTMIELLKKNRTNKCSDHISHNGIIFAGLKLESQLEEFMKEDQFGFQ